MGTWADPNGWFIRMKIQDEFLLYYLLFVITLFPIIMYGRVSWTTEKAEHRRIDTFKLSCWRTLVSPLDCKETRPVHPKGNQPWIFTGRNDAEAEAPILWPSDVMDWTGWKRPWVWDWLKAGGEGDNRGRYGWMASPTHWTWVSANCRRWWRTG